MHSDPRRTVSCLLLAISLLACPPLGARSAVCPTARDLLTAETPFGQFAKSMWQLGEAKINQTDLANSILIVAEESTGEPGLELGGYFWWRGDGQLVGCSQWEGTYDSTSRELRLRTTKISSESIPSKSWFSAVLSADGQRLEDFRLSWSEVNDTYTWLNRLPGKQGGPWSVSKVYPLPVETAAGQEKQP